MPKSDTLPLRRCPCWPGPYSRRLTGLLGRPKTFSPMRRSSLYLALVRFVTVVLQLRYRSSRVRAASELLRAGPPLHRECGANCEAGHLGGDRPNVKFAPEPESGN